MINELSVQELQVWANQQTIFLIDVREPAEYATGHIKGSTLMPLSQLNNYRNQIPHDLPVVVVCRSGQRSSMAAQWLESNGWSNIYNTRGGMLAWSKAGLPEER